MTRHEWQDVVRCVSEEKDIPYWLGVKLVRWLLEENLVIDVETFPSFHRADDSDGVLVHAGKV
jgi:hypothetical protein